MKKILILAIAACLLCSCASYQLEKTIWYNTSIVEKDGENALLITSFYFFESGDVDIYSSVRVDSVLVVKPFKYAEGTYSVSGNPKKEARISINAVSLDEKALKFNGAYHKADAMILISQDSIAKVYGKLPEVTLPY